ncbi:MAG: ABC transporter permease [Planctomycetota bacterium]|nr:MAG: ABC transporter permease [Planctomycetota bacterium]
MRALIWKDFMANRVLWIGGLALILLPYLLCALVATISYKGQAHDWWYIFANAPGISCMISFLVVAMVGGVAIAGERPDRSSEFLAYLPPSRAAIITSKAMVGIGVITVICLLNMFALYVIEEVKTKEVLERMKVVYGAICSSAILIFGFAWLYSSFLKNPIYSTGLCIATVLLFWMLFAFVYDTMNWGSNHMVIFTPLATVVGIGAFVGGIFSYLHRVEP